MRVCIFHRRLGTTSAACLAAVLLFSACAPGLSVKITPTPSMEPTMNLAVQATRPSPAGTASPNPVGGPQVTISNFTFGPDILTVTAGTTVTWVNQDDIPHTVTSVDKLFASPALDTGDRFIFKFTSPGSYSYFCSLHPRMVGKIIVP